LANDVTLPVNTPTSRSGGSDVSFTRTANTLTIKLIGNAAGSANEQYNPITDYHVNSAAQIRQYKLLMTRASTTATSPTGTQQQIQNWLGLSAYDPTMFSLTNGWVTLKSSTSPTDGITLDKLQKVPANGEGTGNKGGLLGSVVATEATIGILTSGTVVTFLEALTKDGRQTLTGNLTPEFDATVAAGVSLGSPTRTFKNVYADTFNGTATKAVSLLSSITPQTYVQSSVATSNASIVQRSATGYVTGVYLVDNSGSISPTTNEQSDVGTTTKRFNNVYTKTISAGSSFSGSLFGSWTLTGVSGSRPELLGPDNGVDGTGANIGRNNAVGRINAVYTRALVADDIKALGMTITNVLNVGSINSTGAISASGITFTGGALPIAQGGTDAGNAEGALVNLVIGALGTGLNNQVLSSNGIGGLKWGAGGGGGGTTVQTTRIDSGRKYFDATAGQVLFTGVPTFVKGSNQLRVYINGVRQNLNDYVEDNGGTSFTLNEACVVGDQVLAEVDAYTVYPTTAASITFSPAGLITVTNVQDAIEFVDGDKLRKLGGTLTAASSGGVGITMGVGTTLNLATGGTAKASIRIPAATDLLATPVAGSLEFDGSLFYVTQTSGPTRQTFAYQSWVSAQGFIKLNSLSVGSNAAASGTGGIGYDNATGVFTYTPPDLSGYQTKSGSVYLGSTAVPLNRASGSLTLADVSVSSASSAGSADTLVTTNNYQVSSLGVGKAAPGSNSLAVKGGITAEGDITAYYTSDSRLKTKIESITGALGKVSKLDGITFNWNDQAEGKDQTRREAGVLAQQIQEVLPEAVAERDNGMLAVRYEQLVPLLIEAIKELKAEVDFLKKTGN
jgi:hypothetical protein